MMDMDGYGTGLLAWGGCGRHTSLFGNPALGNPDAAPPSISARIPAQLMLLPHSFVLIVAFPP